MSFVRTRRNSSKPQIIKLETDDDDASKSTGKPCIDFQPDDRWQIKEEDESSMSGKKKPNSPGPLDSDLKQTNNKSKSPAIVNGESTTHLSDSENSSSKNNSVSNDDNKTEDTSSSKEECNNDDDDEIIDISSPSNSIKRNCRVRKKRKISACDSRANGKKARSSRPENSDNDVINCSSGEDEIKLVNNNDDEVKPVNDKNVKPVNDVEIKSVDEKEKCVDKEGKVKSISKDEVKSISKDEAKSINTDEVKSINKDNIKPVNEDKSLDESKGKTVNSDSDEPSKSVADKDCSNKDVKKVEVNGSSNIESKADDSLAAPVLENEMTKTNSNSSAEGNVSTTGETSKKSRNMPELSSIDHSQSASKKNDSAEDEIMVINDKKSPDGGESDNEIQIIENTNDGKDIPRPRLDEKICGKVGTDQKLSAEEILLSPGYPYYNSIAEKVTGFKAGLYNPVRFPHTGTLLLSDTEVIIESPSLLVPLLIKESDEFPKVEGATVDPQNDPKQQKPMFRKNFFQSSVGQFLINLGASRVLEWYHRDMKRTVIKQARKSGHTKELDDAIQGHEKKLSEAKEANLAFNFRLRRCGYCDFKTESLIVMEAHYLTPHLSSRREYKCNFCPFLTRDVKEISFHFEAIHSKKAILENQMLLHECLFCTFQSHLKSKVSVHMNRCRKNFIQSQNQSPPYDFEFPGVTTKPVSLADINGHRRMILGSVKAQAGTFENYVQSAFAKKKLSSVLNIPGMESFPDSPTLVKHLMGPHAKQPQSSGFQLPPGIVLTRPRVRAQQMRQLGQALQPRGLPAIRPNAIPYPNNIPSGISITPVQKQDPAKLISGSATAMKNITLTPISSAGNQVVSKGGPPQPVALFTNVAGSDTSRGRIAGMAPGTKLPLNIAGRAPRMVPPYQRLNTPPSQVVKNSSGNTFVMCEICDAYIKDLDELRSHMNWVHKVKIHPKMLVSRPPLNCQKCQWRFFTDQGLERHLLGAHGLVTTNMQEMANNNQDGGRCIICGAVFTYKLVSHMTQVHKVTLKPAHLSYKCTVCTATFTLYRLFESHVYNLHSGSSKRSSEETTPSEPPAKKIAVDSKEPVKEIVSKKCKLCSLVIDNLDDHIKAKHMKGCSVKMCRIDKCNKCLYSTDELLVIRMSDFGIEEEGSSDESDSDSDSSTASEKEDEPTDVKSASDSIKEKGDLKAEETQ